MNGRVASILMGVVIVCLSPGQERGRFPLLHGPYLGQKAPGLTPQLFAPGSISTGMFPAARTSQQSPERKLGYLLGGRGIDPATRRQWGPADTKTMT